MDAPAATSVDRYAGSRHGQSADPGYDRALAGHYAVQDSALDGNSAVRDDRDSHHVRSREGRPAMPKHRIAQGQEAADSRDRGSFLWAVAAAIPGLRGLAGRYRRANGRHLASTEPQAPAAGEQTAASPRASSPAPATFAASSPTTPPLASRRPTPASPPAGSPLSPLEPATPLVGEAGPLEPAIPLVGEAGSAEPAIPPVEPAMPPVKPPARREQRRPLADTSRVEHSTASPYADDRVLANPYANELLTGPIGSFDAVPAWTSPADPPAAEPSLFTDRAAEPSLFTDHAAAPLPAPSAAPAPTTLSPPSVAGAQMAARRQPVLPDRTPEGKRSPTSTAERPDPEMLRHLLAGLHQL